MSGGPSSNTKKKFALISSPPFQFSTNISPRSSTRRMSGAPRPTTPTRRVSVQAPTTPSTHLRQSSTYGTSGSPAYATTTRRHSLYGTEDRVIIDPGSRVWKVGFSGEGKPRHVGVVGQGSQATLWGSTQKYTTEEREEADRMLAQRLQDRLRSMFFESLLTDPKSRKVIIVEHPLLPLGVKDLMAQILFDNLSVPSISFAPSHLLALMAAGRMTGLVLDCGHLESVALPIVSSRPMYPLLRTTPVAGIRFTEHLKQLILHFGSYKPPLATLGGSANLPSTTQLTGVPEELLTDELVEEIKTQCCFTGEPVGTPLTPVPAAPVVPSSDAMAVDEASVPPSSDAPSESSRPSSPIHPDHRRIATTLSAGSRQTYWESIAAMYQRHSIARNMSLKVDPPGIGAPTGRGTLIIPGWVRERAAEVLFEGGDVDESSVAEVILDCLMRVPLDLRKTLISSILVVGGTAMLPGFIPRLRKELARTLDRPTNGSPRRYDPYAPLKSLASFIAIINDPAPPPSASSAAANAGKAPAFAPALFPWVGGSLAGALKTGGEEILRERWDEAQSRAPDPADAASPAVVTTPLGRAISMALPDWTRVPLMVGAPHAGTHRPGEHRATTMQQEPIGA